MDNFEHAVPNISHLTNLTSTSLVLRVNSSSTRWPYCRCFFFLCHCCQFVAALHLSIWVCLKKISKYPINSNGFSSVFHRFPHSNGAIFGYTMRDPIRTTILPGNAASIAFRFSSIFLSLSSCNWCLRKETHPGEYQALNPNKQLQMNAPKKTHGTYMKYYEIIFCVPVFDCILLILIALVSFLAVQINKSPKSGVVFGLSTKGMGRN